MTSAGNSVSTGSPPLSVTVMLKVASPMMVAVPEMGTEMLPLPSFSIFCSDSVTESPVAASPEIVAETLTVSPPCALV